MPSMQPEVHPWAGVLLLILSLAASGCASRAPPPAAELPFQCEDGRRFTAVFARNPDRAVVRTGGLVLLLQGIQDPTTRRYGDGVNTLHGSGPEATLQLEGLPPSTGCVRVADAPPPRTRKPSR